MKKEDLIKFATWFNKQSIRAISSELVIEKVERYLELPENKKEAKQEDLFWWDGITNQLEEIDSFDDAESMMKEYCEGGEIHPDIESCFVLKKIAFVSVQETGDYKEHGGEDIPVCNVTLEEL